MKTKFTILTWVLLALLMTGFSKAYAETPKEDNPNFRYIDDFEMGVSLWWPTDGSGSTIGIILEEGGVPMTYREHETEIVNPATNSTGSMKLAYKWDTSIAYEPGLIHHLIRQHMPAGDANVPERTFLPDQAIEAFVYGDGSGNKFRFMTRENGNNELEGSQWFVIDWVGWKRITWRLSEDPVIGWVNGNGEWSGNTIYFDSFQLTWSGQMAGESGALYFDDLRIVDPFNVDFVVEDSSENPVTDAIISLNGNEYDSGLYNFELFPGEYQYFVKKEGYLTSSGAFTVDDTDLSIEVSFNTGADQEYLVTFTVFDTMGELITDAVVSIDGEDMPVGEYTFDATPGFYDYVVSRSGFYPYEGLLTVVDANVFVNVELVQDPAIFNNILLSWDVAATAENAQNRAEHYSVWIAPMPIEEEEYVFEPENFTMVFEETLNTETPAWEYQNRTVEISGYQNTKIRVAFRHHNVTGMERLVIDNVEITALRTGDDPALVLSEDFSEGVVDPIDPSWLPEDWLAIDLDEDGRNWYFAVLETDGYLASRSRLANNDPLSPDNWLVSTEISLPVVMYYDISFEVKDQDGNDVTGATITINDETLEAGVYTYSAPNGTYAYSVAKEGYQGVTGEVTVAGADQTVQATIIQERFDVTFNLNARYAPDFEPGAGTYYITGSFPDINWAEPGTLEEAQLLNPTDNVYIFTLTMELPAGTYEYKYFNGPSYNDGEWAGGDNRTLEVTGPMVVDDWFGYLTDPTTVPQYEEVTLNLYPNPARVMLNIVSNEMIRELRIINMLGQVVFSSPVNGQRLELNVAEFRNGFYFVHILTYSGLQTRKVQIMK
ncbi:MAG: T9SS type A sorting domain-containing protein [Bacteroidales bacterium]|jgi:hypothetical protein|nr:T9SS type A sorting domain-containing protein [Bacteroidales bacterium]NLM92289.1 T9SS type A sorting domain-containing protein [Bacteroidales bacterium]